MFLDIHELQKYPIVLDLKFPSGKFDYGAGISQTGDLVVKGIAEIYVDAIRLRGSLKVEMALPCARCLESTPFSIDQEFDLFYSPISTIASEEEVEIRGRDLEVGFYDGDGLQLEDAMREQTLLSLPMKSICRDDCTAICLQCGQNHNAGDCRYHPANTDPRWSSLEKFSI